MGTLRYDGVSTDFDDLLLAHLHVVIMQKLRMQESFALTWHHADGGRRSVWLHAMAPLSFSFTQSERPALDREWVDALMRAANSPTGLLVTDVEGKPIRAREAVAA